MIRAALLAALLCGCTRAPARARAPSDEEVRRLFAAHRGSFEELRDLLLAEPVAHAIGFDRTGDCRVEAGAWRCDGVAVEEAEALRRAQLSPDRYRRYCTLLADAQATSATRSDAGVEIVLFIAGLSTSGVLKEVRWSPQPVAPLVADTDAPSSGFAIRNAALDGAWTIERVSN